ncbi:hypothetical protein [Deinococcus hopiensis]|uniref:Uncharacterized protein n=1 Tax=Deinococcus hopiensis KR-140 TaxID=695939 RepID=A0A1W1UGS3_9DEIO|nr:hypothetical protein [Deinococcus hopiensis]SMB80222.1 hypothetical protein SAMN00790413_05450 [Deinococcus hopiensis KR-140]
MRASPPRLRLLRRLAGTLAVLALLALPISVLVSGGMTQHAALVQRVEPSANAEALFGGDGGPGTPLGSPQRVIIRDEKAFLPGTGENGARFVSEAYLREHGLYPLQVKTVEFVRNVVAAVSLAALLLFGALWMWARRTERG